MMQTSQRMEHTYPILEVIRYRQADSVRLWLRSLALMNKDKGNL